MHDASSTLRSEEKGNIIAGTVAILLGLIIMYIYTPAAGVGVSYVGIVALCQGVTNYDLYRTPSKYRKDLYVASSVIAIILGIIIAASFLHKPSESFPVTLIAVLITSSGTMILSGQALRSGKINYKILLYSGIGICALGTSITALMLLYSEYLNISALALFPSIAGLSMLLASMYVNRFASRVGINFGAM